MMSNKVLRTTAARCVVKHTVHIVDSQPTTASAVMVTRDPHEEVASAVPTSALEEEKILLPFGYDGTVSFYIWF